MLFFLSNFRSELAGLLRECLVLAPPAVFLALAILNQFAQTAPTSSERKDQRELQEIGKVTVFLKSPQNYSKKISHWI